MTQKDYATMIYDEKFNMQEFMEVYIKKNYSSKIDGYKLSNFELTCFQYKHQEDAGTITIEKYTL